MTAVLIVAGALLVIGISLLVWESGWSPFGGDR